MSKIIFLIVYINYRIDETTLLADIMARHTGPDADPMTKHKLRPYLTQGQDKWRVLMKVQYSTTPEERLVINIEV